MSTVDPVAMTCPAPHTETERILLGHGSGGQLMAELLRDVITPALGGGGVLEDAAVVPIGTTQLVFSTDSFVVTPRFFPGGDIGSLAVHGTVNDIAMRGAEPVALSVAYVLEEGLPIQELRQITASVAAAADEAGVPVVTGDTKVVERGCADGIYLTTTGIGVRRHDVDPSAARCRPGDLVLVSGPIGAHGMAVLSAREDLGFESGIVSDSRPLHRLVRAMLEAGGDAVHALRDPTRGGVASALNELAEASAVSVELDEQALPISLQVGASCELLGLDPLHVANEGCLIAMVAPEAVDRILTAMHRTPEGSSACAIGRVGGGPAGRVTVRTLVGSSRVLDMLIGEQLPRIC